MHFILATSPLDPLVNAIAGIIFGTDRLLHAVPGHLGWSLVIFALIFKLLFWPLNTKQFKAMIGMQRLAPKLKALQAKYGKSDPQRYQRETMELYRTAGVNPLAGCWPMLVQYPIILSVYWAVWLPHYRKEYVHQGWLWIGAPISQHAPQIFHVSVLASSLANGDLILLVLYMISMYLYSRYAVMPSTDPSQAQMQKMMAIFSPLMLGFFGLRYNWPSAMVLYWFAYNAFTMGQQFYLLGRYHQPLSALDDFRSITDGAESDTKARPDGGGSAPPPRGSSDHSRRRRRKRGARR